MEQWKQIQEVPEYEISDQGCLRRGTRILNPHLNRRGYRKAQLWQGGKRVASKKIHTLVLEAFVGPRPRNMECRHLDGNPENNAISNLRWGTWAENHQDALGHGRRMDKLTKDDATEIRQSSESIHELSRRFKVCRKHIRDIRSGKYF